MRDLVYIDTSMLLKRYLPELGSDALDARLVAEQPRLIACELVKAEMVSALRRKQRQGLFDREFAHAAHARFLEDLHHLAVQTVTLESRCVRRATDLLQELETPLATLDALHLATALEQHAQIMFTHDAQLSRAARAAGLATWPDFADAS